MTERKLMPKSIYDGKDFFIGPGGNGKHSRTIIGPSGTCFYCGAILYGDAGHHSNCSEIRQMYKELDAELARKIKEEKPICYTMYDEEFEESNDCNKCDWYVACTLTAEHERKKNRKR